DHRGGGCVRSINEASASMCCTALRAWAAIRSISCARPSAPGCSCSRWRGAAVYWILPRSAFHSSVTESSPLSGPSGPDAWARAASRIAACRSAVRPSEATRSSALARPATASRARPASAGEAPSILRNLSHRLLRTGLLQQRTGLAHARLDRRPLLGHQPVAIRKLVAGDGDGRPEHHRDETGTEEREALRREHLARARDPDGHAVEPGGEGGHRRALLEGQQIVGGGARSLGKEEETDALEAAGNALADRLGRPVGIAAIDEDVPHPPCRPAEEGQPRELPLADEAQRFRGDGDDGRHVDVAGVIRDEDVAARAIERVHARDYPGAGAEEHQPEPGAHEPLGGFALPGKSDQEPDGDHRKRDERDAQEGAQRASDHRARRAAGYSSA